MEQGIEKKGAEGQIYPLEKDGENCKNIREIKWRKRGIFGRFGASLTVEAALILPALLSVLFFFLSFLQIIRVEQKLYYTATQVAEETAACGYLLKYADKELDALWESGGDYYRAAGFAIDLLQDAGDALWIRKVLCKKLSGEDYVEAMVVGGISGIDFWGSESYAEDEMTVVRMNFRIAFPIFQRFLPKLSFEKTVLMRSFSGRGAFEDKEGEEESEGEEEAGYVYITESGTVYHTSANCIYIRRKVQKEKGEGIAEKRNQYGAKYYRCESCMKNGEVPESVFVTKAGTRYHATKDCSKIKRTVKKILFSEASAYRPCSRCAKDDEK